MKKKLLVVEPWLGEFGWLLMRWQGHIRWLSRQYERTIVCHAKNHADRHFLFQDFADSHVMSSEYHGKVDRWSWEVDKFRAKLAVTGEADRIIPSEEICHRPDLEQEFVSYKRKTPKFLDNILIHPRSVKQPQHGVDRNWPKEKWVELVEEIKKTWTKNVVCIGSINDSMWVPQTIDRRGFVIDYLAELADNSCVLIGPSSGPHHLAALCECPSLVWSGIGLWDLGYKTGTNRERYTDGWNPFKTPVTMIDTWQPSVETVFETLKKVLG